MTEREKAPKERKLRVVPPGPPPGDRVSVKIGAELHENIASAARGLARDPDLYHRGGALVRVVCSTPEDGPTILPHGVASLRGRLSCFCYFQKFDRDSGAWVPCLPSDAVTKAIHESPETWQGLRVLNGVPEYPVMLPSGDVLTVPGYEPATGLLYRPAIDFGAPVDAPTWEQSAEALRYLWVETGYDFPFRGMGYADPARLESDPDGVLRFTAARERPDAWGMVSAILTLLARPAIMGDVPAHVFDATGPGAGKGLQADVVSTVVFGRVIGKLTYPGAGGLDVDHVLEQMLGGEARNGALLVILDEVKGTFGGSAINKVLTGGGRTKFRPLGATETRELPWRALLLATGNNVSIADNTIRRSLVPRLEPPLENPERYRGKRRHPKLLHWIRSNRASLVRAALTVLRGYVAAGRPTVDTSDKPLPEEWGGGFEDWSAIVARAIRWAGGGDVMGCRPSIDPEARNEEAVRMEVVLDALTKLAGTDGITAGRFLDALYPPDRVRGRGRDGEPLLPDGFDDARSAVNEITGAKGGRKPDTAPLGNFFRTWKKRPIGERQLQPLGLVHNAQRWGVAPAGT